MAEETLKTVAESDETNVVSDVPEPEPEKVAPSTSFKEETNVVAELPDPQKKALDELKLLVQEALNKHEFSAQEKPVSVQNMKGDGNEFPPAPEPVVECKQEEKDAPPPPPPPAPEPVEKVVTEVKTDTSVDEEDGAKKIEAIQETIVKTEQQQPPPPPPPCAAEETPIPPEEVSIWGIPLLSDERSDVILLKFLRARDFKVKEAFTMLKNVIAWRKDFNIESLLEEEDLGTDEEQVVFMHGVDKEGHPVCYNAFGEFRNKQLYQETFSDEEKRKKFIRWRIQFLEKSIRKLDFSPNGVSTIVQINDLKYSPAPFKKELRQVFQLLQDNYPEFVAKQVFINVPWWYLAFYKMINPFFTQRTKSKFVFAGPSKTTETLFKYISPELVPVQYGGLSREGEQEFTTSDLITEDAIKPTCEHAIELPAPEACTLVWEARVVGSEVSYGAEFVPSAEDGYTVIVQKSRKVTGDESVICGRFRCGEAGKVVLTFYNQSSKKKKVLYRFKKVASE